MRKGRAGRAPCCDKAKVRKGPWSEDEDSKLISYIQKYGHGNWRALPAKAGLLRCGKSCRLRWVNYLSPDVKRGNFTTEEETMIINLHAEHGNKWSKIASYLPGRTDNEIKNVWNTKLSKGLTTKDDIEKPKISTTEPQNYLNPIASSYSMAVSSAQPKVIMHDPNMSNVKNSRNENLKVELGPSTSTIPNISSLDNINSFREVEEELLNYDDDLFQTSLDPDFNFWFMLENTNQKI